MVWRKTGFSSDEQDALDLVEGTPRLARDHDLILIAPATADLMAKMAHGIADDLATAVLLATDKPVLVAPAMNPKMWQHEATKRNRTILKARGIAFCGPASGEMAVLPSSQSSPPDAVLAYPSPSLSITVPRKARLVMGGALVPFEVG